MILPLEILTVMLVAVAMSLALAHALEHPGKMRLDRETYLKVQTVYYPGFTIGGAAEPLAIVALAVLLAFTPAGTTRFWLVGGALAALAVMHAIFWVMTQPVNRYWLRAQRLNPAAAHFFGTQGAEKGEAEAATAAEADPDDWTRMRDRWELSHQLRTIAAALALVLLTAAVALDATR